MNIRTRSLVAFVFVLTVSAFGAPVLADTVYLKSGNKLRGTVIGETENEITMKMEEGMIALDRAEIRSISKDPYSVISEGDEAAEGGESPTEGAGESKKTAASLSPVKKAAAKTKNVIEVVLGVSLTRPLVVLLSVTLFLFFSTLSLLLMLIRRRGAPSRTEDESTSSEQT